VAVIPVDPSSHRSGGSILGDKTRMDQLSCSTSAYVRASPTKCFLGGIAQHTVDVMTLCEYANYDGEYILFSLNNNTESKAKQSACNDVVMLQCSVSDSDHR
jgi:hypothetical protein